MDDVVTVPKKMSDIVNFAEILGILLKGKWWIVGFTLFFSVVAVFYLWQSTPIYIANSLVQVESERAPLSGLLEMNEVLSGETPSQTEIQVIRSRFVLGYVVNEQNLQIVAQPHYFPVIGKAIARRFVPTDQPFKEPLLGLNSYAWGGELIQVDRFDVPVAMEGRTFTIILDTNDRYRLMLNEQTILRGKVGKLANNERGFSLFVTQLKGREGTAFTVLRQPYYTAIQHLQNRLSVRENGNQTGVINLTLTGPDWMENQRLLDAIAQRYIRQNVERVSAEAQSSLVFLEEQLPLVKAEVELAESRLNNYRLANQTVDLTLETQAVLEQAVGIDAQLAQLDIKLQQLEQRYTTKHPMMIELSNQRAFLQNRQSQFVDQTQSLPATQQEVLRLARDVEVSTQVYTQLLNSAQELKIVRASTVGNVRVLDPALSAIAPVKPKKATILVVLMALGALVGTTFVFVRELLNQGVKTPEEVESSLGLAVYATIPACTQQNLLNSNARKKGVAVAPQILAQSYPRALSMESLRALRTNLAFTLMESDNNRIMITGASPGVGKSFVSSNLAYLLAEAGQKVLLIEGDLRKGHLDKTFGFRNDRGLAHMLAYPQSSVITHINERLDLIAGGSFPPNPSELLMSQAFRNLLDQLSACYDVVLIDTPPVLAVTDASLIGKWCATNFMIVRAHQNHLREIEFATARLQQSGINVRGFVFNGLQSSGQGRGHYGYYQYEYSS